MDQAERIASALERDAARNKKPVEVQSDVPADADAFAEREAAAGAAGERDE